MRRFLLLAGLFVIAWLILRRMLAGARAGADRQRKSARPAGASTELVRDRVCNTFIPRSRALSLMEGDRTHYFCSEKCRSRHKAGTTTSDTEELAS